jgi:hypothetical protein
MSKLHLVTVATHSEGYLPVLDQQIKEKGMELKKLGWGKEYSGHFMKDMEMMEFLEKDANSGDLVIFVDGFDSLIFGNEKEIVQKFQDTGAKMLFSVENVTPLLSFIHAAVFERVAGKYINSGLYMGERDFMLKFLKDIYSSDDFNRESNQKNWCNQLHKLELKNGLEGIELDTESKVFLNHSFTTGNYPKMKDERIILKDQKPCFVQGNGKEDMSWIISETGHSSYDKHKGEHMWKKMQYNMRAVFKVYNPILTFYIYLIILGLILIFFFLLRRRRLHHDTHFYL